MRLKVYAPLGEASGKTFEQTLPHPLPLRRLLREFASRWRVEGVLFDAAGELNRSFTVLINGTSVRHRGGLDTPVTDRDEVAILTFVTGGGPGSPRTTWPGGPFPFPVAGIWPPRGRFPR